MKKHQPTHVYLDKEFYFLSVHCFDDDFTLLDNKKLELLNKIQDVFTKNDYKIYAYAILDNHYHLIFKTCKGTELSKIMQKIHGGLSYKWNGDDDTRGRKIFQNYWDYCLRDENDFYKHLNYVHINPIKHNIVKDFKELEKYKFCSFKNCIDKLGRDLIYELLEKYPVTDYLVPVD